MSSVAPMSATTTLTERHQAADKALARAEKREHRQHGSQDEINDKCIIHAFHLPFK